MSEISRYVKIGVVLLLLLLVLIAFGRGVFNQFTEKELLAMILVVMVLRWVI
jgi:hypothetical protein